MKLPAQAIAIAFASGIAIDLWSLITNRACPREFVFGEAATATAQFTFLLMETIWKFRASWRARKSRLR